MLSEHRPPSANGRVTAFLKSQRGLMSYYAAEGKSVAATWPKQSSGDSRPGSPMLVPRTAAAKDNGPCDMVHSTAPPDQSALSFPIDTDESLISKPHKSRPVNPPEFTRAVPIKPQASQRKSIDPDKCSDDEPERLQRLEQRRNRRRARRYAMGVAPSATSRAAKASATDLSPKTNTQHNLQSTDKMDKKKGRAKVAPALLLMQNFSSQSLGKSRLTMRPSPTVGVFNKGKNSGKIMKKGERAERLVPAVLVFGADIVFSESKFLNKIPSAPNINEDTEDDSDDHSAHSLVERAYLQKNRAIKFSQSNHKVIIDQISRAGSSVRSSRSTREESPPWDIEETVPSSPSSVKPAKCSAYNVSPAAQKDITVSTERSVWASRLRNPEPHTLAVRDNANSAPGSHLSRVPPAQSRTTSVYFASTDTPEAPPIELDEPEDRQHGHRVDSYPVVTPDPVDPPSTPECLQLGRNHYFSASGNTFMDNPETFLPLSDMPLSWPSPLVANPRDGVQYNRDREIGAKREVRYHFTQKHVECIDRSGLGEYSYPRDIFPVGEAGFHEAYSDLDYDAPFDDEVNYLNDNAEYPYEDQEDVNQDGEDIFENTAYVDADLEAYTPTQEYDDLGSDNLEEDISLGNLNNHDLYMERVWEEELYRPVEWSAGGGTTAVYLDTVEVPELDNIVVEDAPMEAEGERTDQMPCLVHIITEASLQGDLIRSTSGYWSAAHRLY